MPDIGACRLKTLAVARCHCPERAHLSRLCRRKNGPYLLEYGDPFGYLPFREHLALMLGTLGITAHPGQILLTHGTSQALELVIHYLLKAGDAALVDDPGYYNMFGNLRLQGIEMLPIPRTPDGPDVAILEKLATAQPALAHLRSLGKGANRTPPCKVRS